MAQKQCTIETCNRKFVAKGYCQEHYDNLRRYGEPVRERKENIGQWMVDQIQILFAEYEDETKDNPDRIPTEDVVYLCTPNLHKVFYS